MIPYCKSCCISYDIVHTDIAYYIVVLYNDIIVQITLGMIWGILDHDILVKHIVLFCYEIIVRVHITPGMIWGIMDHDIIVKNYDIIVKNYDIIAVQGSRC